MLNASDHFVELLCPVPGSGGAAVTGLSTNLHRYLLYHGRHLRPVPCWKDPRVAALPHQLDAATGTGASLCFLLMCFLLCCSGLVAKFIILGSIGKEQVYDGKREDGTEEGSGLHDETDFFYFPQDRREDDEEPSGNDVVLEGEALLFWSKKETATDTILRDEFKDGAFFESAAEYASLLESNIGFDNFRVEPPNRVDSPSPNSAVGTTAVGAAQETAERVDSPPPNSAAGTTAVGTAPVKYVSTVESNITLNHFYVEAPRRVRSPPPNRVAGATRVVVRAQEKSARVEKGPGEGKNLPEIVKGFDATGAPGDRPIKKASKLRDEEEEEENVVPGLDTSTVGSTSKSSADWRSSTNLRDGSETTSDHLFSSSSRRSSSKWESYALFRKYDEEMMFFDRISAQKLNEAESLRSVRVRPRSLSQRMVHKLTMREEPLTRFKDPYKELEGAYVAQICLAWEALNWNYGYFQKLNATSGRQRAGDDGCSAHVAQQFQQFQVLLHRFVESEPYEYGRRPEIYARVRMTAPKLLQVPELRDPVAGSTITWPEFLSILEDAIRTFMGFLRADKENPWHKLRAMVKKRSGPVDPALLRLLRKINEKKRRRLKDLIRTGRCPRRRKLREEDEMEFFMALIDMKVVARVLRMADVTEEQLHWCEEKMSRVKVWGGKMQRDSSPLFFPAN